MKRIWDNRVVRWAAPLLWMALIFFLSAQSTLPNLAPDVPHLEEVGGHLAVYGVLALLWERALRGAGVRHAAWWALAITLAYGASDEFHQSFVPGRTMTMIDWIVDLLGAGLALTWSGWVQARGRAARWLAR